MASADFLVYRNTEPNPRPPQVIAYSFLRFLQDLHNYHLVFLGLCSDVATYPDNYASYPVPVRQYRILPFGFLQCIPRGKPPCHLLMFQGVTPAHKGLSPSGIEIKHSRPFALVK